jgi:ATP-dependent Clp protease ATP-binding subunit ClpC
MREIGIHPSVLLAWSIANQEASLAGSKTIEPAHFFLAILKMLDDAFMDFAVQSGLDQSTIKDVTTDIHECRQQISISGEEITRFRRNLRRAITHGGGSYATQMLHRSEESRVIFRQAMDHVVQEGGSLIRLIHIFQPILQNPPREATELPEGGMAPSSVSAEQPNFQTWMPNATPVMEAHERGPLAGLGRDLTELAHQGKLAPVVGRQNEMLQVARYLMRTSKRNVLLIGPAGVGKTAIVEGLAQKLVQDNVPDYLRSIHIMQVSLADIVAGTKYRGEMEERLQKLVDSASKDENLVIFFDEIHLAMKTGGDSSMDIANILKPALAQNAFRCIGATTTTEYEKYIREDSAFNRRFQLVMIDEPSADEALVICEIWAKRIEELQKVTFEPEAVRTAVDLANQYITDRCLPDKAIDLLENAASYVKVSSLSFHSEIPETNALIITPALIKAVLEEQYGIAIQRESLLNMDYIASRLKEKVIGQESAIDTVLETLVAIQAYPEEQTRPFGVLLFVGPSGIGKTYLAECLCEAIFGDQDNHLLRINMNEFKEHYDLSVLVGAPPGLIGHDRPGLLSQFTATYPRGLILLDEMEKAHHDIHDFFLQIFDKAAMTDARGRKIDFRQYIFVMTCNLTTSEQPAAIGFIPVAGAKGNAQRIFGDVLGKNFRPEFIGRIDRIVEFHTLSITDYQVLWDRQWKSLSDQLSEQYQGKINIAETDQKEIFEFFCKQKDGARGFIRMFRQRISMPALQLAGQSASPVTIELIFKDGEVNLHNPQPDTEST